MAIAPVGLAALPLDTGVFEKNDNRLFCTNGDELCGLPFGVLGDSFCGGMFSLPEGFGAMRPVVVVVVVWRGATC